MNLVDVKFYQLIQELKMLSNEQVFEKIKMCFMKLDKKTRESFEDFFERFNYWGSLHSVENDFEEIQRRANSIFFHLQDFVWLYERLGDYRSKKLLYVILNNWYCYDFTELKNCYDHMYPDYFDLDLVKCDEEEVLVDLGAFTGDTVLEYMKMYQKKYKKIYCYEITEESLETLRNNLKGYPNIEIRNKAVIDQEKTVFIEKNLTGADGNKIENLRGGIKINGVSLDEDILEKVTTIKMDIEGSEQAALLGCKRHIQEDKPKLLLSVYHNHEDIWKIPRMIEEMQEGYRFYLRYHGGNYFPTEVTLIAICE